MTMGRRGIAVTPMETRRELIVEMACRAERLGYEAFILPEGWGLDSTVVLAEIATKTSEIKLIAGILSIWGRTPAQIAMAAGTLQDLSAGRFILGLGASTPLLAEGFHDVDFDRPARALEAALLGVKNLLDGGRALLDENRAARPLRLMIGPAEVPIWIGALGPKTIDLTARLANGWFPVYATFSHLSTVRSDLASIRAEADEMSDPLLIACGPTVGIGDPEEAKALIGFYLCAMGDGYANFVSAQGYSSEVAALRAANPKPSPSHCDFPAESRVLLDQLLVSGSPDAVRDGLSEWDEIVDLQVISMIPGDPWEKIERRLKVCAPTQ